MVNWAAGTYRGDGKTDARDAGVIADQARMRRDLTPLWISDELATELRVLMRRREDLTAERTRSLNRMRAQLLEYFPALARAFDFSKVKGALTLLARFRTPAALREVGLSRLISWLKIQEVRNPAVIAGRAISAAESQHTVMPGEQMTAEVTQRLVRTIQALDQEILEIDKLVKERLWQNPQAELIMSLTGMGPVLAAELLVAAGGDVTFFGSADRLAAVAGLLPAPRDSGRVSGNLRRPQRYSRRLMRVFYLSAMVSIRHCPASKAYYARKRNEGKRHDQAVIALARRRVNVLWAILRDGRPFEPEPPSQHVDVPTRIAS